MEAQSTLSIPWLNDILVSNWWPVVPLLCFGVFRGLEYLVTRLIEGKPEAEKIEQYSMLADLQKKLAENKMSIGDLERLRGQVLGKEAENAIHVAEQYTRVASQLVENTKDAERPIGKMRSFQSSVRAEAMTQAEMNAHSAAKAHEADSELTALVMDLMQRIGTEEAEALQRAQDQWSAFRMIEAERDAKVWEGGSIRPLLVNAKFEALTRERIASLRADGAGPDGVELEIRREKIPRNLFEHLELGVPKERIKVMLGTPTYIRGDSLLYRYEEAQVEITFDKDGGVSEWVVALCAGQSCPAPGLVTDVPLGRLTLADLLEIDPQVVVQHRWSMRTREVFVRIRVGPPGAWDDYYFGALATTTGAGNLQDVFFKWDDDSQALITDPREVVINWVGMVDDADAPYFSWFISIS